MYFADIHTHILHNIDDGSSSLKVSLDLLESAYATGTRTVFFTPHCNKSEFDYGTVNGRLLELAALVRHRYPEMQFYCGCEGMYSSDVLNGFLNGNVPTLASSRYVLVEFDIAVFFMTVLDAVRNITINGLIPVIAHAERYMNLNADNIDTLVETGAYIQLNADSITGKCGLRMKLRCLPLLKRRLVHFVASDAHGYERPASLKPCADYLVKRYGSGYAQEILFDNALKIVDNNVI